MADSSQTLQARQLEVLVQIAQLIATLDLDEVLQETIKLTTEVVGATKGSFFLLDEQGRTLQRFIAARDIDPQSKPAVSHLVLEGGLAGWVLANKHAALLNDTTQDPRWVNLGDEGRVRSAICVPFFVDAQVRGVMTLEHPEPNRFTQDDLRLAQAVGNQAGAALRNAQLFDRVQSQQRQLEAVLGSISEAVLVVDHEWRVQRLNPTAQALIGEDADHILDRRLDEISDGSIFRQIMEVLATTSLTSSTQTFEIRDDTSRRDFVVNIAVLRQENTEEVDYVIALYDVTSMKDLARLKTHMIRMASHDLKNPLALLVGYLDMIADDVNHNNVPNPAFIENLYKAITRMETLIASLLDTESDEQGATMKRQPIDPYELIDAALDDMLPAAEQHQHRVVKNIASNLHPIKGDFVQLREAMDNLISNAVKYTPDGGTITIGAYSEEDRLYFSVKDTGYGIPADQQSKIFQPYFRANQPETEHITGTGVGLSLVKEVVGRHGGNVWFESQEGQGSTFGFWLPVL
jgi:signal transduction histidine kinase